MKKSLIVIATLTFVPLASSARPSAEVAVRQAVSKFIDAGDRQDAKAIDQLTAERFRVVFQVSGAKETTVLDRKTYRQLLTEGKLGGKPRRVDIRSVQVHGRMAHVQLQLQREDAVFDGAMTLVESEQSWKVIQDAVMLTKR